jgi:hypothetical protein
MALYKEYEKLPNKKNQSPLKSSKLSHKRREPLYDLEITNIPLRLPQS